MFFDLHWPLCQPQSRTAPSRGTETRPYMAMFAREYYRGLVIPLLRELVSDMGVIHFPSEPEMKPAV